MKENENRITWIAKSFDELTNSEFHDIIQLRIDVFIVEQNCPYRELDGKDEECIHIIGLSGENKIVATARIAPAGVIYAEPSIGRVVTHSNYRGQNLGKNLMGFCIDYCKNELGAESIKIAAQEYLEKFYSELGFKKISETYMWDGIEHIDMRHSS